MRIVLVAIAACLLMSCGGSRPEPQVGRASGIPVSFGDADPHDWSGITPSHYSVHGIDVSKYQGDIDWLGCATPASASPSSRRPRAATMPTSGSRRIGAAQAAGLPRGAYHYYYFCRPALEQAAWFIEHVPRDPSALPPVLDLEWTHKSKTCPFRPDATTVQRETVKFRRS